MNDARRRWGRIALAFCAIWLLGRAWTPETSADLVKCQLGVDKEVRDLWKKLFDATRKCSTFYLAEQTSSLAKQIPFRDELVAGRCERWLEKSWKFPDSSGKSASQKALDKLVKLTTKLKCTSEDLKTLGHLLADETLESSTDNWARRLIVSTQGSAWDKQKRSDRLAKAIMTHLFQTGSCPLCEDLDDPCFERACVLSASSGVCSDTQSLSASLSLSGAVVLNVCDRPDLIPDSYTVHTNSSKTIAPTDLGLGNTLCIVGVGGIGYIAKTDGAVAQLSYDSCIDHTLQCSSSGTPCAMDLDCPGGETCIDECEVGSAICDADASDPFTPHVDDTNGGLCVETTPGASVSGAAYITTTWQITLVSTGEVGTDGTACTDDDTDPGFVLTVPLTTASADAKIFDADSVEGATLPTGSYCSTSVTGTPFNVGLLQKNILSGAKLVGAVPLLHNLFSTPPGTPGSDNVVAISLECN